MKESTDNQMTGWQLYVTWFILLIFGWVLLGVVIKLCLRLFFLGWDLV